MPAPSSLPSSQRSTGGDAATEGDADTGNTWWHMSLWSLLREPASAGADGPALPGQAPGSEEGVSVAAADAACERELRLVLELLGADPAGAASRQPRRS